MSDPNASTSDELLSYAVGSIAAGLPMGICVVDEAFKYVSTNWHFAQFLGYEPNELIGLTFLDVTHPSDRQLDAGLSASLFARKIPYFSIEKRWIRKDESIVVGTLTAMSLPRKELNWGVALVAPKDDATTRDYRHEIAHDINNLLFTASTATERLQVKYGDSVETAAIFGAVRMASSLLENLVTAGAESNDQCDAVAVTTQCISVLMPATIRSISYSLPAEKSIPVAIGETELGRILMNVLNNAIDAIATDGTLNVSLKVSAHFATFEVSDTGVGMTNQELSDSMTPYFTSKGVRHHGLGLSIAKKTLDKAGGRLAISSTKGIGTTVTIYLPLRHIEV